MNEFDKIILLLGPSAIGKTTIIKKLVSKLSIVNFVSLDNITHRYALEIGAIKKGENLNTLIKSLDRNRENFLSMGEVALKKQIEKNNKITIVDVGAGFLDATNSSAWVDKYHSICFIASPAIAYQHFCNAGRRNLSLENYITTQFSALRQQSYQKADVVINADRMSIDDMTQHCAFSILAMLPRDISMIAFKEMIESK